MSTAGSRCCARGDIASGPTAGSPCPPAPGVQWSAFSRSRKNARTSQVTHVPSADVCGHAVVNFELGWRLLVFEPFIALCRTTLLDMKCWCRQAGTFLPCLGNQHIRAQARIRLTHQTPKSQNMAEEWWRDLVVLWREAVSLHATRDAASRSAVAVPTWTGVHAEIFQQT